ncbi:MAG: hypothetical protein IJG84_13195 [Kiritimatiellae bacterium]|nr:hypothetical protein [Kiritimatiellia bacterium]
MFLDVFIGMVKSDKFDFDVPGNYNGYMPDPAYEIDRPWPTYPGERDLYWAILDEPNVKKLDWGCSAVKMSVPELQAWLSASRWQGNVCAQVLLSRLPELDPGGTYLLVAVES